MKSFTAIVLALSGAAVAQQFPDGFPECGRICVNNMLAKAAEFNCAADDAACLCNAGNFRWGINDCAWQACQQNQQEYSAIVRFGSEWCANAGAPSNIPPTTTGGGGGGATTAEPTDTGSQTPTATENPTETTSGDATALSTETWTSTLTTDGTQVVVTGTTTYSGVSGVTGASSLPQTIVTTDIVSTVTDATTTFETTIPSTFTTVPTGSELTSALESQASTSTSQAWGAQVTAPPALGFFAAAGIAAALL